jgi:hypothetical protein
MQCHRVQYGCIECHETDFPSEEELLKHIQRRHAQLYAIAGQNSLLQLSRKPVARLRAADCPCCTTWAERRATRAQTQLGESRALLNDDFVTAKVFKRHLASHLEQLALFALELPTLAEDEAGLELDSVAALSESERDALSSVSDDSDTLEVFDHGRNEDNETHSKGYNPQFIFRIDEMKERSDAPDNIDPMGNRVPINVAGWRGRRSASSGITERWFCHNGDRIQELASFTPPEPPYKTHSMFYNEGDGFWSLRGGE